MAREKTEINKIEKRAARHVTFSKRRRGLVKKAQELSILCEADIGFIVFSATGKLFEISSSRLISPDCGMAREKITIKKIEKRAARHVTFSKRRKGLVKKAQELSILCEADIGLIIFSATGKLFEFSSSSMEMILEKYSKCLNASLNNEQLNLQLENEDVRKLKQEIENINCSLRYMHGQALEELTVKKVQQLEKKLEVGLNRIRLRKDECLFKEILELQKKVNDFQEENAELRQQLKERRCCHEKTNAIEPLFIQLLKSCDHPQSSETTIHTAHNEASETSLQLGLSI